MRLSITGSFSLEGLWTEPSDEPLKTTIRYRLLTYEQVIKYRNRSLSPDDLTTNIFAINNCILGDQQIDELTDTRGIKDFLRLMEVSYFNLLIEEMLKDSMLTTEEFRRLEFIVYYLNWKADEHSRRTSYDCTQCRKYKFLDSRMCYLESPTFKLPDIKVIFDDNDHPITDPNEEEVDTDEEKVMKMLNDLSVIHKGAASFEIFQEHFFNMWEGNKKVELCPEAFKIHSENLAELFEMEARCSEYNIFPFEGGQFNQVALIIEAFDAIRSGRNTFHSKKMEEVRRKNTASPPPARKK
jgi:hypothetical protein